MSNYVLRVNENMILGKSLMDFLKSLSKTSDYVEVMPQKEEYPYNPEFVSEIVKSRKGKGVTIKREDLWT